MSDDWPRFRARLPNALSRLRIGLSLGLIPAALTQRRDLFWTLLIGSLASDALDGFLARRLHVTTDLGRRLDSWGDYTLLLTLVPSLVLLWPELMRREAAWIGTALAAYFAPTAWSVIRHRTVPGFHTWASKAMAVGMAAALPILLLGGPPEPLRAFCGLQVVTALEEFAIIHRLPGFSGSMPSYWHARRHDARA